MDLISLIFIVYLCFLLLVGFFSYGFSKTQEDYFLAGRKLGPWVTAFSERASGESAWLLLALPGAAITIGLGEIWSVMIFVSKCCFFFDKVIPDRKHSAFSFSK